MSDSHIRSFFGKQPERFAHNRTFPLSDLRIAHGRSFLVSNLSGSLTSLIFGERPERFAHIAHQKQGISESLIFLNKKTLYKHPKK